MPRLMASSAAIPVSRALRTDSDAIDPVESRMIAGRSMAAITSSTMATMSILSMTASMSSLPAMASMSTPSTAASRSTLETAASRSIRPTIASRSTRETTASMSTDLTTSSRSTWRVTMPVRSSRDSTSSATTGVHWSSSRSTPRPTHTRWRAPRTARSASSAVGCSRAGTNGARHSAADRTTGDSVTARTTVRPPPMDAPRKPRATSTTQSASER